jgi:hypothetical protein
MADDRSPPELIRDTIARITVSRGLIAESRALLDYDKCRENAHAVWQDVLTADSRSVR